jgi:hypothetical protein
VFVPGLTGSCTLLHLFVHDATSKPLVENRPMAISTSVTAG